MRLKNIVDLIVEGKKLRIFDFDDTLVQTDAKVYVINKGRKKVLTPGEYAVYVPAPGDEFDFSDFKKLKHPKIIKKQFDLLKKIFNASGSRKIVILTARSDYKPIYSFLSSHGIPIEVVALSNADPKMKAKWIEKMIQLGYDDIFFVDDSRKNLEAVNKLKNKYPNIDLKTRLAKLDK